ncbi:hypothetical protein ACFQGR_02985 [Weissella sagaensis]|uniref:Uncharacterized protein n=1 Tax=Weissella sagaensis TaxID=2559928 RepID=A0ABW1RSH6_9LACO|nr:hypothetical protein [Weissella sagaensis]MBU7568094.1 hypothetical protein [Weissella hellenica]QDJ58228.1 hypothetical protein EFA59_01270 [Weissella hellenica]QEA57221.1 hypothetical protein FGL75_04775 [Weissella hellenica]UEG66337.1 hypothetical protein GZH44_06045 [Weissella hellenica]
MKRVLLYIIIFVLGVLAGGVGVHYWTEYQGDRTESQYESSYRGTQASSLAESQTSSDSQSASSAVDLPSQDTVTKRVNDDLNKFIKEQKQDLIKQTSVDDAVDAFEDSYLDTYENELQAQFPGETNENQIEHLIDVAVTTINVHQKVTDAK